MSKIAVGLVALVVGVIAGAMGGAAFGTGLGAGAGAGVGIQTGICAAMQASKDAGMLNDQQVTEVMQKVAEKYGAKDAPGTPLTDASSCATLLQKK